MKTYQISIIVYMALLLLVFLIYLGMPYSMFFAAGSFVLIFSFALVHTVVSTVIERSRHDR